jgi:hypothetical protein
MHHDRPVTPEVAGSSPVAPVKIPANRVLFFALRGASDLRLQEIPRTSRTGIPQIAGRSREFPQPVAPAKQPEVVSSPDAKEAGSQEVCPTRQRSDFHPAQIPREGRRRVPRGPAAPRYGQFTVWSAEDEPWLTAGAGAGRLRDRGRPLTGDRRAVIFVGRGSTRPVVPLPDRFCGMLSASSP